MTHAIVCCINNLVQHRYGDKLNELASEGLQIGLERCLSQCVGCRRQPAFAAGGRWHGVEPGADFKNTVYTKLEQMG